MLLIMTAGEEYSNTTELPIVGCDNISEIKHRMLSVTAVEVFTSKKAYEMFIDFMRFYAILFLRSYYKLT